MYCKKYMTSPFFISGFEAIIIAMNSGILNTTEFCSYAYNPYLINDIGQENKM